MPRPPPTHAKEPIWGVHRDPKQAIPAMPVINVSHRHSLHGSLWIRLILDQLARQTAVVIAATVARTLLLTFKSVP